MTAAYAAIGPGPWTMLSGQSAECSAATRRIWATLFAEPGRSNNSRLVLCGAWITGSLDNSLTDSAQSVGGGCDGGMPSMLHEARAIAGLEPEKLATYTRIVLIAAPDERCRRALETLMATVFKNEFLDNLEATAEARGEAIGEARGEAWMILQVLDSRGFTVPPKIRDQILDCADTAQLEAWGRKAAVAQNIEDIFGTDGSAR